MVIDKQTMQRARRVPDAHAHRAIQTALDNLDTQSAPRRTRWVPIAAAGAAALMLVAVLAAVPPLRHRAVSFALDALGRAVPQADRVNPAGGGEAPQTVATARADSAFLRLGGTSPNLYQEVAKIASVIHASLTKSGMTMTVEEAALTTDKLFFTLKFDNVPPGCDPIQWLHITVDGQSCTTVDRAEKDSQKGFYLVCTWLPFKIERPNETHLVNLSLDLLQFTDTEPEKGKLIDLFSMDFPVSSGEWLMEIEMPVQVVRSTPAALLTARPESTVMPSVGPDQAASDATTMPIETSVGEASAYELTPAPSAELPLATATPLPTPDATGMPSDESQGGVLPDEPTPVPSASAGATQPKFDARAEGWTEYDIELGSKTLSIAAPSHLKRYDLTTPEQRVHLASMELTYNDETDGVTGWPSIPSLLNDNSLPLAFFDGQDGVIQVLAYDPGTTSMDGAVQKLDVLWSCGDTSEDSAGNQVTQLIGRTTDKYQSTSSLLLYRLPKGEVTIDGKSQPCPFLIVRVVSHKDRDLWMAILQDNISIQ